ncbi:PorP/SprF family type IX secretion system membrane protein [Mucilaginibacter phyllosphaerae]|uniref:Type IX secretion system PorP/SprF family membrane protein n=1 Tax=Mucilaginibacter phyllosphaerae TaxID=1812349 RepID=A0A4Y8AID6_9SPHI|nr:PorP/SprF family type IX secretion system membrane protein [Mucilaginibacter phyllosphaerae]MBB3968464.1 type IX secretion system PorP/SprF family membrane protein [Mucilaginibacter phyllosphaerae]TEW67889.1 type IX secretion system membrane protein PorP/SprF [Mucilaginibacter phyllosphaerae]GGH15843.1 membrane protein [Mucilaginibacter phyllosphaerae]
MKKLTIMMIAALLQFGAANRLIAQIDPHFSQYYAYPLYLNPALTGVMNGDLRINANFKNQYANINNAYQTGALSVDYRPTDKVGLGFNVINQAAGDVGYNYFAAYGSFGYAVAVSNDGFKKLSFGVQAGLINRGFDPSKAQYGSQYNPSSGFDPTLPSNENFLNSNATIFDAGAGVFYYDGDPLHSANIFGGLSASHLTRSKDPIATNSGTAAILPIRWTAHAGVRIKASDFFDFIPHAVYMRQQKAEEKAVGAYSEFKMNNDKGFIIGGMYRFKDAAVANVGYRVNSLIIGASYDFNTSSLNRATFGQGGLELSLSYVFRKRIQEPEPICPRL